MIKNNNIGLKFINIVLYTFILYLNKIFKTKTYWVNNIISPNWLS